MLAVGFREILFDGEKSIYPHFFPMALHEELLFQLINMAIILWYINAIKVMNSFLIVQL